LIGNRQKNDLSSVNENKIKNLEEVQRNSSRNYVQNETFPSGIEDYEQTLNMSFPEDPLNGQINRPATTVLSSIARIPEFPRFFQNRKFNISEKVSRRNRSKSVTELEVHQELNSQEILIRSSLVRSDIIIDKYIIVANQTANYTDNAPIHSKNGNETVASWSDISTQVKYFKMQFILF